MHNDNIHWSDILNHIHLHMYRLIVSYFNCVSDATWVYGRGGKRGGGVQTDTGRGEGSVWPL